MISTRGSPAQRRSRRLDPADADAIGDFADDDEREFARGGAEREQAGADRGDGEAVKDQGGGIVGEPFAVEHDDQPARQSEPADDGERSDRVGRRHDGAEHEADRERQAEQIIRGNRDRRGGEDDQPKASSAIGRRLNLNSRQLMATPAE